MLPCSSMRNPYEPVPILEPVEITRVELRTVGYRVICLGCGTTFRARLKLRRTCSLKCRKRLHRVRKAQALQLAQEQRGQAAERRLCMARLKPGLAGYVLTRTAQGTQPSATSAHAVGLPLPLAKANPGSGPGQTSSGLPLPTSTRPGVS